MKKAIVITMLLVGVIAMAQPGKGHKPQNHNYKDMTPEQIAILQTKKMTLALDLDEAQQQKIQLWNLENINFRKEKMETRKAQKEKNEKPNSDVIFALQNERLDHQIAQKEQLKAILSEAQFKKFEKMKFHRKKQQSRKQNHRKSKR